MKPLSYQEMMELDHDLWILEKNCQGFMTDCDRADQINWWQSISRNLAADFDFYLNINNLVGPQRSKNKTVETEWMFTPDAYYLVLSILSEKMKMTRDMSTKRPTSQPMMAGQRLEEQASCGCVYVLKSGDFCKIGRTSNLTARIPALSIALPQPSEVVVVLETTDHVRLERDLHKKFSDKRVNGEWFILDDDDIAWIRCLETPF